MTRLRALASVLVIALAQAFGAAAMQAQATGVTVEGIAYDSLRREVLPDAFVTLGHVGSATTDSRGRFSFGNVTPGVHILQLQHARLDSMGLPGVSTRTTITDGRERVVIAIPSFATIWRAACGTRPAPRDSGIVYGAVRDARTGNALAGADVALSWIDLKASRTLAMSQRRYTVETRTDERGEYGICGVPAELGVRIQAAGGDAASGTLDVLMSGLRIRRRDLAVGPVDTSASAPRGLISGTVTDPAGGAIQGARIVLDDAPAATSNAEGRFFVRGVPLGTRQLEIFSVGTRPVVLAVDVVAEQTSTVAVALDRVTFLDQVNVIGTPWQLRVVGELEERKRGGFGTIVDSTSFGKAGAMSSVFSALPSVTLSYGRANSFTLTLPGPQATQCTANLFIDGWKAEHDQLSTLRPGDIAVVESYPRYFTVPFRFMTTASQCGAIVVWTKYAMP